jgi:2'-5' RNA ligase
VRLFLAVNPAGAAREQLRSQAAAIRSHLSDWEACVRWAHTDDIHITLRFLGEMPASRLATLTAALGADLPFAPFPAEVDGAGVFTARGRVRTLWLSIGAGRAGLVAVHAEISRRLRADGWPDGDRPFAPHLTIGRVRDRQARRTGGLAAAMAAAPVGRIRWQVDRVVLLSSDLSGPRPVYTAVHELPLAGRA